MEIYRLYEKTDETTDLIGSDYYLIKDGENDFKGYKKEDISIKINDELYEDIDWELGNKIDLNIEHIQNVNYSFKYADKKDTSILNKMYLTDKINIIDKPIINDYDIEKIITVLQKIIDSTKNKEDIKKLKYDIRLYSELMGECRYVKNENLKYLFLVYKK